MDFCTFSQNKRAPGSTRMMSRITPKRNFDKRKVGLPDYTITTSTDDVTGTSLYILADLSGTRTLMELYTPRSRASSQRSRTRKDTSVPRDEKFAVMSMAMESLRLSKATAKLPLGEVKGRPKTCQSGFLPIELGKLPLASITACLPSGSWLTSSACRLVRIWRVASLI